MVSSGKVQVGSWVTIRDGCPISYHVTRSASTEFRCGPELDRFEFVIEREALREFVRVATDALRDVDARLASERAERTAD